MKRARDRPPCACGSLIWPPILDDMAQCGSLRPNDPQTLAVAAGVLLAAALAAGYGPARRASRVDPMVALRHE
jgi:hypothetical protein